MSKSKRKLLKSTL